MHRPDGPERGGETEAAQRLFQVRVGGKPGVVHRRGVTINLLKIFSIYQEEFYYV